MKKYIVILKKKTDNNLLELYLKVTGKQKKYTKYIFWTKPKNLNDTNITLYEINPLMII